jgi:uncharacterized protein (DUF433 family)
MDQSQSYVSVDEHGVRRVAGTRISLDSVVIGFQNGESAEEIQRNFPALNLEQVYGTIAHYLAHREEIDTYLSQQHEHWDRSRTAAEANAIPTVERLRNLRAAKPERVG